MKEKGTGPTLIAYYEEDSITKPSGTSQPSGEDRTPPDKDDFILS